MVFKNEICLIKNLPMEKKDEIKQLVCRYGFKTKETTENAFREVLALMLETILNAELTYHLGYGKSERFVSDNYRNGAKLKRVITQYGDLTIKHPKDRKGTFEPVIIRNRQKILPEIDGNIIALYADKLTDRQITRSVSDLYETECAEGFAAIAADKIAGEIKKWRKRCLNYVYPFAYVEEVPLKLRRNGCFKYETALVVVGITLDGHAGLLSLELMKNMSGEKLLEFLNEFKAMGGKGIRLISELSGGLQEAAETLFPTKKWYAGFDKAAAETV